MAATFAGKEDLLEKAVEALRGKRLTNFSFHLPAFACIPVKLLFWDGDDEFPAQGSLISRDTVAQEMASPSQQTGYEGMIYLDLTAVPAETWQNQPADLKLLYSQILHLNP